MSTEDDEARVKENLTVIRNYLSVQFDGLDLTKDNQDDSWNHWFTMTDTKSGRQHTLKVKCTKLPDTGNTPEKIKQQLVLEDVANRMRAKPQGDYYTLEPG